MSAEPYYCTVYDVAQVMGLNVGRFGDETRPAKETVDMVIRMMMDFVDRYTRKAWRERWNYEMEGERKIGKDLGYEYHRLQPRSFYGFAWTGFPVFLKYAPVKPFDPEKGDSVQVFTGQGWEEWVGVRQMGENYDWWANWDDGIIYFRRMFWFSRLQGHTIRFRYRFGYERPNDDIRYATALLVACHLIESGDYVVLLPEGASNIVFARDKVEMWRRRAMDILDLYKAGVVVD